MSDLPTHATGVLAMFSTSKTGIDVMSDQLIESVKSGEVSPLQVRVWIKSIEMVLERVNKETQENQINAAEKYAENKFEYAGASVEKADFGKFDYSTSCDPEWERHDVAVNSATESRKAREAFLRTLQAPITLVDESTGEIVTIKPPLKKSVPGLKISIK